MNDIYVSRFELENCQKNKEINNLIMHHTSFHYIIDGYGYFDGQKLGKGQFFCAAENNKVCYYPDRENPWTYIFVDVYGMDALGLAEKYMFAKSGYFGDFYYLEEIKTLYKLYCDYTEKCSQNKTFSKSIANTIISLHMPDKKDNTGSSLALKHVNDIKEYLDFNFHKKISIEDISKMFFLSRPYIRNIFLKYINMSPKQYLQKIRMEKSAEMLLQTSYSISLIASSVGYDDQLAFSKAFRSYYKKSPSQYRKSESNMTNSHNK